MCVVDFRWTDTDIYEKSKVTPAVDACPVVATINNVMLVMLVMLVMQVEDAYA